ncbi:MAG: hypothetical protein CMJ39_12090 [Phycisphaerae bacterium]|nr:hypothetical protein [Phycisphaerae bacterium]
MSFDYVGSNLVGEVTDANWTVRVYLDLPSGERLDAVAGNSAQSKIVSTTETFYQNASGGPTSQSINSAFFAFVPDMEWDSYVTIGCLYSDGTPFGSNALNDVGIDWSIFEAGGTLDVNDGTWFVTADDEQGEEQSGRVLVGQFTIIGDASSSMSFEALFQGRLADGTTSWQESASITIPAPAGPVDCNDNGVEDADDIANGTSQDCNGNGVPDECDLDDGNSQDCDNNGTPDECQGDDCDGNGVPDSCDLAGGAADCNNNGVIDSCDINDGTSNDCDNNGTPDECQNDDCDGNGVPDSCDLAGGAGDCNNNGVIDSCDIADESSEDCDGDGTPDECETDSDGDGTIDDCEYTAYLNVETGVTYDTFDDAAADAGNTDRIDADFEAINAETHVDFRGKALEVTVINGELAMAIGTSMNLGNGSRLEAGADASFAGSVRTNGTHAEILASGSITVADAGSMTVRENMALELMTPAMTNEGEMTVRDGGDLDMNMTGSFVNNGTLHCYGACAVYVDAFENAGDMTASGHFYGDLANSAAASLQMTANTVLSGDLNNDGYVNANVGSLYVLGNITNNGTIVGDVSSGLTDVLGNLRVAGDYVSGADSSLILPSNWQLTVGGDFDIAINDSSRLLIIDAAVRMAAGLPGIDTVEAMSADLGETLDGIDASNFAYGDLVIGMGNSVQVVDNHVNGAGNEIMYVRTLTIEPGATFDANGKTVWCEELINEGTYLGDVNVIDPVIPCDGNLNGDDFVNIDDLLIILGDWGGTGGDANGDGATNIDDILVVLSNWGPCGE